MKVKVKWSESLAGRAAGARDDGLPNKGLGPPPPGEQQKAARSPRRARSLSGWLETLQASLNVKWSSPHAADWGGGVAPAISSA